MWKYEHSECMDFVIGASTVGLAVLEVTQIKYAPLHVAFRGL